jgi:type IV pilus assembly protein PilX
MNPRPAQSGMALLVSLVLLLLLTIIAIAAANRSTLQERMAANSQQQNIAFQASESGIQGWLDTYSKLPKIDAIATSKDMSGTVKYSASAPIPDDCWSVMPAYSLNVDGFRHACFNIISEGKSCVDSNCNDSDNPARARHRQGHLVRY